MSLYEHLTEQDLANIKGYCDTYGFQDNDVEYNLRPVPTEQFLNEWSKQKEHIFHLFGDKFILEKSIAVDPTIDLFYEVYDDCMAKQNKGYELAFVTEYKNEIVKRFQTPDYWGLSSIGRKLMSLVDLDKLYTNTVNEEIRFELDGKKIVIHKGEKIMRALRKVSTLLEIPFNLFEEFRIFFSQVTQYSSCQQNNTLCLSIHPLDFMTMSDNVHGWTSCMSWEEPGSYRGGTLEMMNSPHVIVAYVTDGRNMELPVTYENWPSKRWRELYYFDGNLITGIKGYPYADDKVDQIVRDWLKELTSFNGDELILNRIGKAQMDEPENEKFYEKYNNEIGPVLIRSYTNYMYNDFERIAHKVYFRPKRQENDSEVPSKYPYYTFDYGGRIFCLACGREVDSYVDGSLCGECCGSLLSCCCCGEGLSEDNAYYDEDGNAYCEDCFNKNFAYDDVYDYYIPAERAVYFQVVTNDLVVVSQWVTDEENLRSCNTWMDSDGMLTMRLCDMSEDFFLAIANGWLRSATYEFKKIRYSYYSCEAPEEADLQKMKIAQMYQELFDSVATKMQKSVDNNPYVRTITPMHSIPCGNTAALKMDFSTFELNF